MLTHKNTHTPNVKIYKNEHCTLIPTTHTHIILPGPGKDTPGGNSLHFGLETGRLPDSTVQTRVSIACLIPYPPTNTPPTPNNILEAPRHAGRKHHPHMVYPRCKCHNEPAGEPLQQSEAIKPITTCRTNRVPSP
ncbi:hypothetical protein ATANTOWER_019897 [Ataeniobius toweri]|uniref:Uncharacterized protein n=1 Tax=Ataeniobius toweri TaxID=208326 RepID=A0ABU7AGB7_9TELE|nr:hypothetical protein [Ataeniobius toweri]